MHRYALKRNYENAHQTHYELHTVRTKIWPEFKKDSTRCWGKHGALVFSNTVGKTAKWYNYLWATIWPFLNISCYNTPPNKIKTQVCLVTCAKHLQFTIIPK